MTRSSSTASTQGPPSKYCRPSSAAILCSEATRVKLTPCSREARLRPTQLGDLLTYPFAHLPEPVKKILVLEERAELVDRLRGLGDRVHTGASTRGQAQPIV